MACSNCLLGIIKLNAVFSAKNQLLTFLEEHNLVKLSKSCTSCHRIIKVNANNRFTCDRQSTEITGHKRKIVKCRFRASLIQGTFFEGSHLKLEEILTLSYWFILNRLTQAEVSEQIKKSMNKPIQEKSVMDNAEFWKSVNLQEPQIPQNIQEKVKDVKISSSRVSIMGIDLFYREASVPTDIALTGQSVLLLHGAAFKSQTWLDLGTLGIIAAMGHHAVAIDLPGYGETKSTETVDAAAFLKNVISTLQLKNVIIVSPSMSGGFSIPFLMKYSNDIIGFIPVAPVQTEMLRTAASEIVTPTLIVYGELDRGLGHSSLENLRKLPNSQVIELPKAKHPAYLDQPKLFHTLIYNFLNHLKSLI